MFSLFVQGMKGYYIDKDGALKFALEEKTYKFDLPLEENKKSMSC